LRWLGNGNMRFAKHHLRADGQTLADVQRLSKGQHPHAIVPSCSDSRVPPEVVFDQKLGELFVVRTAGEALDSNVIGSIEYAIEHLGSRNLVVMGHSSCGAVKAALGTLAGGSAGSPHLDHLVADLHPRLATFKGRAPTADVSDESWANARGVAHDLMERSTIITAAVTERRLKITPALYDLGTGVVHFDGMGTMPSLAVAPLAAPHPASVAKPTPHKH
jgi:carbonic anhydrase